MPRKRILFLAVGLILAGVNGGSAQEVPKEALTPKRHEFVITNFKTESGVTLPQAHVVYGPYGKLNDAHDNVVLLPSYFMANFKGYE